MALAETTLSAAVGAGDKEIAVASATSVAAGRIIRIDDEVMEVTKGYVTASTTVPVLRGRAGTRQAAHVSSARVVHGNADDFTPPAGAVGTLSPGGRVRRVITYSAASTITPPQPGEDMVVVLTGTSVVALTIAVPTKDLDGCRLTFIADGTAAHTLTFTGGVGGEGSGYDVITFNSGGPCAIEAIACNEVWLIPFFPAMTGTVTNLVGGIA